MPDKKLPKDWREAVDKMTDNWSANLEDLMLKHSEEEFLNHAASAGVNFNLIQTEALEKLVLEDVGFVAQTNKKIGQSIIDDIEKILITKGDWGSAKESVLEHVNKVFSGQEKIVIDNIGKQAKRAVLDAELGHVVLKDFIVKRKWTGNIDAYSDMVSKSLSQKARTMGDLEGYRTTIGIIGWRRMSSLGGRTCELCASLHGRAYYFAGEGVDTLPSDDGMMFEPHPNGYCYQTPIYDEWTGLKNLNEGQLDDHLERWKIDTKSPIKNLKRVPIDYGRGIPEPSAFIPLDPVVMDNVVISEPSEIEIAEFDNRVDLTKDEMISVNTYIDAESDNYKQINRYAGGRKTVYTGLSDNKLKDTIRNLDSVIEKSVVEDSVVLYRGIHSHVAEDLMKSGGRKNLGFTSTTYDPEKTVYFMAGGKKGPADWNNLLVIKRDTGSKGIYINKGEAEFILPRNLEYKLTRVVEGNTVKLGGARAIQKVRILYVEEA